MAKRKLNKVKLVKANARERVGQPPVTKVKPNKKRNHWLHPCCNKEDRDYNGGCRSCGDPGL